MCATFQYRGRGYRPGQSLHAVGAAGAVAAVWAGFARRESLSWWQGQGGLLLDIPAERFAERSKQTGRLIWADVPDGLVIRGLLQSTVSEPLIKIVTRAASPEEWATFQHPRAPLLEPPLFPSVEPPPDPQTCFAF